MTNISTLCRDIEEFLKKTDQNSVEQFFNWIKHRSHIFDEQQLNKTFLNSSQLFLCQCGQRYSINFSINQINDNEQEYEYCKNDLNQIHHCQQNPKYDELKSLEQLIPPDTIDENQSNKISNQIDLPKLTDSIVEIIHSDGKRQYRCPLCFNSYVNRSGLNRHYITHSSQDLWKVECQFCSKRYSRKDSLKHHMKTQHAQYFNINPIVKKKNSPLYHRSNEKLYQSYYNSNLSRNSSNDKEMIENDDVVLVT